MFEVSPLVPAQIKGHRCRRGVIAHEAVVSNIRRVLDLFEALAPDSKDAWTCLLSGTSFRASGWRPDAAWLDEGTVSTDDMWKDGLAFNYRRGMFGLTLAEFGQNHVKNTSPDIYHPYSNIAAGLRLLTVQNVLTRSSSVENIRQANTAHFYRSAVIRGALRLA